MADPLFDQISATTLADLQQAVLQDNFFVDTAWQRIMKHYSQNKPFTGGTFMQVPFQYDRVNGGAYAPASDVTVIEKQIIGAMGFPPRAYKEDIALNLFQIGVVNNGPAAAVSVYDAYYENAVTALSTDLNIDFYAHGQTTSGTSVKQDRSVYMNGIDEALSDGINPGWMGNVYSTYGGQQRNGIVGNTINSVPIWAGDATGNTGQFNWGTVVGAYLNCVQPPDTILSNKALFQYAWQREEPKQRFAQEADARIGLTGFHVFNAHYHVDKLAPSTKFGTLLPSNLSQTTGLKPSTFTSPTFTAGQNTISNFPSNVTCNPGEPMFLLRLQDFQIRPSDDPEYNHNFTPLIRTQTNPDLVVAWYKCAVNMYTPSPRDNAQIVGFGF